MKRFAVVGRGKSYRHMLSHIDKINRASKIILQDKITCHTDISLIFYDVPFNDSNKFIEESYLKKSDYIRMWPINVHKHGLVKDYVKGSKICYILEGHDYNVNSWIQLLDKMSE